jgi:hypothetical protein
MEFLIPDNRGYSAGRKSTIDVTDLIWKCASMKSFSPFAQPAEAWSAADFCGTPGSHTKRPTFSSWCLRPTW